MAKGIPAVRKIIKMHKNRDNKMIKPRCFQSCKGYVSGIGIFILMLMLLLSPCQSGRRDRLNPALGVCTSIENADLLKQAGYDYVEEGVRRYLVPREDDVSFQTHYAAFQNSPLPIYACNSFLPGSLKSTGPDARHDEILAYSQTAFARARETGIKIIVFGSGGSRSIPEDFDPAQARVQFVSLLKRMGPLAAQYDVAIVIEPLNKKECNFINTVSEATDIARRVNHPNIKVLADFYHMMCENEGPESILKAGSDLRHCHIAELKDRRPPGTTDEDFTPYLRALKQIGYKGRISIECRWQDMEKQLPIAIAALKTQIDQVN